MRSRKRYSIAKASAWITVTEMRRLKIKLKRTRESITTLSLWAVIKLNLHEWMANRVIVDSGW